MSIQNAINFISDVDSDSDLRKSYYKYKTQADLLESLASQQKGFTADEFANAVNMLLFKCDTYDQAGRVKEIQAWFKLFKA